MSHLDKDAAVALLEVQVGQMPFFDLTVKKEAVGKLKTLHYGFTLKKGNPLSSEVTKKMLGKAKERGYVTVDELTEGILLGIIVYGMPAWGKTGRKASGGPSVGCEAAECIELGEVGIGEVAVGQ